MAFLDWSADALAAAPNGPTAFWSAVYGLSRSQLAALDPPGVDAVQPLLQAFEAAIQQEAKPKSPARAAAIGRLIRFSANPRAFKGHYRRRTARFVLEVALRVREPKLVDQMGAGICGQNSMVIAWVKNDPDDYVKRALQLFKHGETTFYGKRIKAPAGRSLRDLKPMAFVADRLVLGAIAKAALYDLDDKLFGVSGTSGPALRRILREIGCTQITYRLRSEMGRRPFGLADLQTLAQQFATDRVVIMSYNSAFGVTAYRHREDNLGPHQSRWAANAETFDMQIAHRGGRKADHWSLVDRFEILGDRVRIKFYTWGDRSDIVVPQAAFLECYGGYVAGDPPWADGWQTQPVGVNPTV